MQQIFKSLLFSHFSPWYSFFQAKTSSDTLRKDHFMMLWLIAQFIFCKFYFVGLSLLSTRNTGIYVWFFPVVINLRGLSWGSQTVKQLSLSLLKGMQTIQMNTGAIVCLTCLFLPLCNNALVSPRTTLKVEKMQSTLNSLVNICSMLNLY